MAKAEYRSAVRSRRLIHTALADLLLEKPLDKITVTDVVNRAEINRGTFYLHYRSGSSHGLPLFIYNAEERKCITINCFWTNSAS